MPRTARAAVGGLCYHVLNRGNARHEVFHKPEDYAAFAKLLGEASERLPMRLVAWCLLPNHFHLVLWPRHDGDLSRWMQWLMTSHVRRYHRHYKSSGHVWQGRFKAFPIEQDEHLLTVLRYVERNPLRANLAPRAEDWRWSSAAKSPGEDWPNRRPSWSRCVTASCGARPSATRRGNVESLANWAWNRRSIRAAAPACGKQSRMSPLSPPEDGWPLSAPQFPAC
jgi:REP element-mobilizing transposase RayT